MNVKKELGKKIQFLRKSKKITQDELSEIIGMDPKNISRIENGNTYPTAENLNAIANALDVDVYELFVFNEISYDKMKTEIIDALNNEKTVLHLYKSLKFSV